MWFVLIDLTCISSSLACNFRCVCSGKFGLLQLLKIEFKVIRFTPKLYVLIYIYIYIYIYIGHKKLYDLTNHKMLQMSICTMYIFSNCTTIHRWVFCDYQIPHIKWCSCRILSTVLKQFNTSCVLIKIKQPHAIFISYLLGIV